MKKSITKKIVAAVVGTMLFGALAATTAMADGQKVIKISYGLVKESGEGTGAAKFEELIESGNIKFNDEDLGKLITSYIATRRVKSFNDFVEKFDEDWTNGFVFTKTDAPIHDAIRGIAVDAANEPVFDLQGRRVTGTLKRGQLYVKGGRKFVAK